MTYWVIRQGKIRGQGGYWVEGDALGEFRVSPYAGGWSPSRGDATRFRSKPDAHPHDRAVRVTRETTLNVLSYEAKVAIRNRALDEADAELQKLLDAFAESDVATAVGRCREAIAALKR